MPSFSPEIQIAVVSTKLWIRGTASAIKISETKLKWFGILALVFAAGFGCLLASVSYGQLDVSIPAAIQARVFQTSFGTAFLTAGIVSTILCVSTPAQSSLQNLISLLPISQRRSQIGQWAPAFVLGFIFSSLLSATSVAVFFKLSDGIAQLITAITLLALGLVLFEVAVFAVFTLVSYSLQRFLRLPRQYSVIGAGVLTIVASVAMIIDDFLNLAPDSTVGFGALDLLPHRIVTMIVLEPLRFGPWVLLTVTVAVVIGLTVFAAKFYGDFTSSPRDAFLRSIRLPNADFSARIWVEILVCLRSPQIVVTTLSVVPLVWLSWWMKNFDLLKDSSVAFALSAPSVGFMLALYAVGRTRKTHWIGSLILARESWWVWPKILAYLAVGITIAIPTLTVELGMGLIAATDIPTVLLRMVLALSVGLLAGALVPYSEEQPISASVAGFLAALIFILSSFLLNSAGDVFPAIDDLVFPALLPVLFFVLFLGTAFGRTNSAPSQE